MCKHVALKYKEIKNRIIKDEPKQNKGKNKNRRK